MDGLRRSIERGAVASDSGGGWQKPAIGALWAFLLLLVGWIYSDAAQARAEQTKTIQALSERVATQEEATRNIRQSLERIESGVNELRRERTK